ncbi:hypothetical protein [Thermomonas fusca]|uniref:Uncharacterized protein n=1 Tax=Thermomonas fusca TaxID=215690 RepID=A0A5R9PBF2_9GAMM|nr:hypothetical protein [Thermomonas fusca]TLX20682.1 hypothetical protein E5S66_13410 [Thermomonas fusca]
MAQHDYQPVEDAFREGTVSGKSPEELRAYLLALANQPIPNDSVRHRDIIRGLTVNHLLLQHHIDSLNRQNSKTQRWVIVLAVAALLSSIVQIFSPLLFNTGSGVQKAEAGRETGPVSSNNSFKPTPLRGAA